MKKTYLLGREKGNDIVISKPMISEPHLEIEVIDDNTLLIKDKGSTNKTKVNGRVIMSKRINRDDVISLGSYELRGKDLFDKIHKLKVANKTDFTKEFAELRPMYDRYIAKKGKLMNAYKTKPLIIRASLTVFIMILVLFLGKSLNQYRYFLMTGVGLIGGFFATAGSNTEKLRAKLEQIELEELSDYKCPKCGFDIPVSKSWDYWASKKECPKCKAKWA